MKKTQSLKKLAAKKNLDLDKEIADMQLAVLNLRIDIANRKTKGIHRIAEIKADIARAKTILAGRSEEKNESS